MSFTYDLTLTGEQLLISQVRLELGDTVEDNGVLPDSGNLSDAEIAFYLTTYANDVSLTVGRLAGILARRWASVVDITVGPRRESLSQVTARWQTLADGLSAANNSAGTVFSIGARRSDGYSEAG